MQQQGNGTRVYRTKLRLWDSQGGKCYWCGCKMLHPRKVRYLGRKRAALPGHAATLDHLDETFTERRGRLPGIQRTVLACRNCNSSRSNDLLDIEEKWKRSGRYPRYVNRGPLTQTISIPMPMEKRS